MERLDNTYLTNIVKKARNGGSNAFAELFTAACDLHYSYILYMVNDELKAERILGMLYEHIMKNLPSLHNPALYMAWSMRMAFRYCAQELDINMDSSVKTSMGIMSMNQLLSLPLTESQVSIMYYGQGLAVRSVADLLNTGSLSVKRALKAAAGHIARNRRGESPEAVRKETDFHFGPHIKIKHFSMEKAPHLLGEIYEKCSVKPHTIPLEALKAYAVYRSERFSVQKAVIAVAIIIFILLPLCFILPDYEVSSEALGERGLPVYTVSLRSVIPAGKVLARINTHALPVYEASARVFTIEPTRNGKLTIDVELINRQGVKTEYDVSDVDSQGPMFNGTLIEENEVHLFVEDEGIGTDWKGIYALDEAGNRHFPLSVDTEAGEVVFEYPENNWDVYIPDYIGNTLHLAFTIED